MEMFQPALTLLREPDGEYTLLTVTICPNSAYSAGRAHRGIPTTVRLAAGTVAVLLPLRVRSGPALQVLTPVRHRLRNLDLKDAQTVMGFVMIDDKVVGSASIPVHQGHCHPPLPSKDAPVIDTADWYAWVNTMPPGPSQLHVTGTVNLPSPGYSVSLQRATPQGINPKILLLRLEVTQRPGPWPQVITPTSVRYDEPAGPGQYDHVSVLGGDDDGANLPIEIVS